MTSQPEPRSSNIRLRKAEKHPFCAYCGQPKKPTCYLMHRACAVKARHGADCFHRWRYQATAQFRENKQRQRERIWRERFPGVPVEAARWIYQMGYKAGETCIRQRLERQKASAT